jgi:hypothetical protein
MPAAARISSQLRTVCSAFPMASYAAFPIVAENGAVPDVVAAVVPQSPFNDMVGVERRFAAATNDTPVPVSLEHALLERVPIHEFRFVVPH